MKKYFISGSSIPLSIVEYDLAMYYISKGQPVSYAIGIAISLI